MEQKWKPMSFDEFNKALVASGSLNGYLHEQHVELVGLANQMWNANLMFNDVIKSQGKLNDSNGEMFRQHSEIALQTTDRLLTVEQFLLKLKTHVETVESVATPIGFQNRLQALEKREGLIIAFAFILGIIFAGVVK